MYFSVVIQSSDSDTTISLTSLNTGYADLYAQVYNLSTYYSPRGGDIYHMCEDLMLLPWEHQLKYSLLD